MPKIRVEVFTSWHSHVNSPFAWTQPVVIEGADNQGLLALRHDGSVVVMLHGEVVAEWPAATAPRLPVSKGFRPFDPFALPAHEAVEFFLCPDADGEALGYDVTKKAVPN